jgi:metallophosphoesterase (TIGR00282 family)
MKILAIGDIFGETGRRIIKDYLPQLKEEYKKKKNEINLVIANVENATHGKGISRTHYQELKDAGIDIMTSGNHIFARKETQEFIDELPEKILLRPLNSNPYHPGLGTTNIEIEINIKGKKKKKKVRITNLIGTTFMPMPAENPYFALEKEIKKQDCDIHLVDFHAETTAEKIALALYYDGEISALWGTHTHVQTADERILPGGTAFITDLGMTGPHGGVIGAKLETIIQRGKYGLPARIIPHEDQGQFNGVIFEFDEVSNKVKNIKRINKILETSD